MRVFTKKNPDPARESLADRASLFQRSRPQQSSGGDGHVPPPPHHLLSPNDRNLFRLVNARAASLTASPSHSLHLHPAFLHSLDFDCQLIGHDGCVNRLAWNHTATLLASGSDDCTVRLWDFTRPKRPQRLCLQTGHSANIFAVGFLQSDHSIVSAGMDMDVRVCDIQSEQCTHVFRCHPNRVKELCVDPSNDDLFLTSGEDGSCRQFDLRDPHQCGVSSRGRTRMFFSMSSNSPASPCHNALVANPSLPLKCVDINPVQPHFFLLSSDDQFIRVFDRRMITIGSTESVYSPCYSRHAAGHLKRSHHSTFSQWDETGTQIVASYSGEQVYVYSFYEDDDDTHHFTTFNTQQDDSKNSDESKEASSMQVDEEDEKRSPFPYSRLPPAFDRAFPTTYTSSSSTEEKAVRPSVHSVDTAGELSRLKELGNAAFHSHDYSLSISYYNEALLLRDPIPPALTSLLLSNRAAAYLKRSYPGDLPIALSDSMHAFRLDRSNLKALYRAVQCHKEMKRWGRGIKLGLYALERVRGGEGGWEGERDLKGLVEEMQKERAKQRKEEAKREEVRGGGAGGGQKTVRRQKKEERKRKEVERKQRRTKRFSHKEREEKHAGHAGAAGVAQSAAGVGAGVGSGGAHREEKERAKRKAASMRTESEEEVRAMETEVTSSENEEKRRRVNRGKDREEKKGGNREKSKERGKEEKDKEEEMADEKVGHPTTGLASSAPTAALSEEEREGEGEGGEEGDDDDTASQGGVWNELQQMEDDEFEELIRDTVNMTRQQWLDKYGEESEDDEEFILGPVDEDAEPHEDDDEDAKEAQEGHATRRRSQRADAMEEEEEELGDVDEEDEEQEDGEDDSNAEDEEEEEEAEEEEEEEEDDVEDVLTHPSRRAGRRHPDNEHEVSSLSDTPSLPPPVVPHVSNPPTTTPSTQSPPASSSTPSLPPNPPPATRTRRSFLQRFVGHANRQTDIKESTFWGPYILSGSDDGHVFMWDRRTARLLCVLKASDQIINCLSEDMQVLTDRGFMSREEVFAACPELSPPLAPAARGSLQSSKALSGILLRDFFSAPTDGMEEGGEESEEGEEEEDEGEEEEAASSINRSLRSPSTASTAPPSPRLSSVRSRRTSAMSDEEDEVKEEAIGAAPSMPASSSPLRFASLDPSTGHMIYLPATALTYQTVNSLVEFTHTAEAPHWADDADEYGLTPGQVAQMQATSERNRRGGKIADQYRPEPLSNGVSLVVDPQHDMFVRVGISKSVVDNQTLWASTDYRKVKAGSLLSDEVRQRVRLLGQAAGGVEASADELPFTQVLELTSEAQVTAFLELYGYWCRDGCIDGPMRAVVFAPKRPHDQEWVMERLEALGLTEQSGAVKVSNAANDVLIIAVTSQRWNDYFIAEYGAYYGIVSATSPVATHTGLTTPKVQSVKWFWTWVWRLRKERVRLVLAGLRLVDGQEAADVNCILTSGYRFRDDIIRLCLHAGYSARFDLVYKAGDHRGYDVAGKAIIADHDHWAVSYGDDSSAQPILNNHSDIQHLDVSSGVPARVWCVTVPPHHLIITRRARRNAHNVVTQASRPVVVGNCVRGHPYLPLIVTSGIDDEIGVWGGEGEGVRGGRGCEEEGRHPRWTTQRRRLRSCHRSQSASGRGRRGRGMAECPHAGHTHRTGCSDSSGQTPPHWRGPEADDVRTRRGRRGVGQLRRLLPPHPHALSVLAYCIPVSPSHTSSVLYIIRGCTPSCV